MGTVAADSLPIGVRAPETITDPGMSVVVVERL